MDHFFLDRRRVDKEGYRRVTIYMKYTLARERKVIPGSGLWSDLGDSFLIWFWLNQHGKEAMLDMPLWSCQLQQHILADPVNSF